MSTISLPITTQRVHFNRRIIVSAHEIDKARYGKTGLPIKVTNV